MHKHKMTRRAMLTGAAACGSTAAFPTPVHAFLPAMFAGINGLVTLWNGYKIAKELYESYFAEKSKRVTTEVARFYTTQNFFIQNYYQFGNPYKVSGLSNAEPGCEAISPTLQRNSTALCCGTVETPVLLPMGCIIALHAAVNELRSMMREDDVFAYTRPIRYARPALPWQAIDPFQLASDVQYFSPAGSVALGWLITDRSRRICRGQYKIRDDNSFSIVALGETPDFHY